MVLFFKVGQRNHLYLIWLGELIKKGDKNPQNMAKFFKSNQNSTSLSMEKISNFKSSIVKVEWI